MPESPAASKRFMTHPDKQSELAVVALGTAEDLRQRIRSKSRLKGRQPDAAALAEVRELLGAPPEAGWRRDLLIEHLHLLNDRHRALHEGHLVALAHEMKLSMAEVFEVATFYHHFEVLRDGQAAPTLTVRVCDSLACELAGASELLQGLPALLGATARVIAAPCVGRCEQAPVAVVGQCPLPHATPDAVVQAVQRGVRTHPPSPGGVAFEPAALAERSIAAVSPCVAPAHTDYDTYCAHGGYALAEQVITGRYDRDEVLRALEDSGLRGLGGAGFPAGRKWRIVGEHPAPRLMAVNIDEGEPGTFKDRTYLERDPHRFLEGVLVAAAVVGIDACYLYLRDEYHGCRKLLADELATLQRAAPAARRRCAICAPPGSPRHPGRAGPSLRVHAAPRRGRPGR